MLAMDGMDEKTGTGKNYKEALEEGKSSDIETSNKKNNGNKKKSNGNGTEMTEKKGRETTTRTSLTRKI
jgi:hypothetical protein